MNRKKSKPSVRIKPVGLVCPDRVTADFVTQGLERAKLKVAWAAIGTKAVNRLARQGSGKDGESLLLVPSAKLGIDQVSIVKRTVRTGGHVVAWHSDEDGTRSESSEEWLVACFVAQAGAVTTSDFGVAKTLVCMIAANMVPNSPEIRLLGPASALCQRIERTLISEGLKPTRKASTPLTIDFRGGPWLRAGNDAEITFSDPRELAIALRVLLDGRTNHAGLKEVVPDARVLSAIVRPPARLLSETTSKRVIGSVGILGPREKLCKSPTKAVQFASSIAGPVVTKLVMPALTDKSKKSAVCLNVSGPSAVRRAVHSLESVASELAPPGPLGVLVSEQVEGGDRLWLKLAQSDTFGRYILMGSGDSPTGAPTAALRIPVSSRQAQNALLQSALASSKEKGQALGASIARFSSLLMEVGEKVERAEIHPLVAAEGSSEAMALDALIGISADTQPAR